MRSRVEKLLLTGTFLCCIILSRANDSWIKDTIIVNLDETYGKFMNHLVEKKQTLFSLANAYGIDLYDVYDYNPFLKTRILTANDIIRIPLANDHIITDESQLLPNKKYHPVYYIIKPKDNLYRISKVYFNMSFDDLMTRNKLTSHTILVGQRLMIGWFDPTKKEDGVPDYKPEIVKTEQNNLQKTWTEANPNPFIVEYKAIDLDAPEWKRKYATEEASPDHIIPTNRAINEINIKERISPKKEESDLTTAGVTGNASTKSTTATRSILDNPNAESSANLKTKVLKRKMITTNGVAQWAKSASSTNDLYVLHPTAPVNSVVEITNPMTHRTIYAKVLSNMPYKLYTDDISVVVSPGVANLLGAIDSRFYVKLRFVEETIQ
jgi:LysM repeat protein